MDDELGDTAVGSGPVQRGTRVRFEGEVRPRRSLAEVFADYTDDFALTRTRVVVKLFTIGVRFISRSEARAHPDISVETTGASAPAAFMIEHARRTRAVGARSPAL